MSSRSLPWSGSSFSAALASHTALTRWNSAGLEADVVAVGGHHRRDLLLDRLQRVARLGRGQVREDAPRLLEEPARGVERLDGVLERGRRGAPGDRLHFAVVLRDGLLDRGQEVLGLDRVEGRDAEGRRPLREEGVGRRLGGERDGQEEEGDGQAGGHGGASSVGGGGSRRARPF